MPAAVGVDIGCGMVAVRTQFTVADMRKRSDLASLRMAIENAIPLSAGKYDEAVCEAPETAARIAELEESDGAEAAGHVAPNWRLQLGSLGSGNHSSRYPSTSRTESGCSCTPDRAELATGWPASTSRPLSQEVVDQPARSRYGLPGGGH